jgi:rubrerythrin
VGPLGYFRTLALRSILKSALTLEEEIHDMYSLLQAELVAVEIPESIKKIVLEEKEHQKLIRHMLVNRIPDEEMERFLKEKIKHIHHPEEIRPLSKQRYGSAWARIETVLKKEKEIHDLFASFRKKSKIPFAKRAFRFLEEQERTHVLLLERLLGIKT